MEDRRLRVTVLVALLMALVTHGGVAHGFGEEDGFRPRVLLTEGQKLEGPRASAPAHLASEVMRRTSVPGTVETLALRADDPRLLDDPFLIWFGDRETGALTRPEITNLRRFLSLGGLLVIDDGAPRGQDGSFGESAKRELARVWPEATWVSLGATSVLFRSFYLLERPYGRFLGKDTVEVLMRDGLPQVILLRNDLMGALAVSSSGVASYAMESDEENARELATRFAVNIVLFLMCSNYKDDQVHATFIMRRRGSGKP